MRFLIFLFKSHFWQKIIFLHELFSDLQNFFHKTFYLFLQFFINIFSTRPLYTCLVFIVFWYVSRCFTLGNCINNSKCGVKKCIVSNLSCSNLSSCIAWNFIRVFRFSLLSKQMFDFWQLSHETYCYRPFMLKLSQWHQLKFYVVIYILDPAFTPRGL